MPELSTVDLKGKRVFLRCDLNVPIKDGVIRDDGRIKASLPTIQLLLSKGASVLIAAHLGRPKKWPSCGVLVGTCRQATRRTFETRS